MGEFIPNGACSRPSPGASFAKPYVKSSSPELGSSFLIKQELRGPSPGALPLKTDFSKLQAREVIIVHDTDDEDDAGVGETLSPGALPLSTGSNGTTQSNPLLAATENTVTTKTLSRDSTVDEKGGHSAAVGEPQQQSNGREKPQTDDNDSELSEPGSDIQMPLDGGLRELVDEPVADTKARSRDHYSRLQKQSTPDGGDETMTDEEDQSPRPPYPKRRRTSKYADFKPSTMIGPDLEATEGSPSAKGNAKAPVVRPASADREEILVGRLRDDEDLEAAKRRAIVGFVDRRDRLRFRIIQSNIDGDAIGDENPPPSGAGRSLVKKDRVILFDHLVGLNQVELKAYVRLRAHYASAEESERERKAADAEAVKEAIRWATQDASLDTLSKKILGPLAGEEQVPNASTDWKPSDGKRKRGSGGSAAQVDGGASPAATKQSPRQLRVVAESRSSAQNELSGTRPTHILLGYWKHSDESSAKNKHAVEGILSQDDKFRFRVVRQTRDGRSIDGNFPLGAGASWIQIEDVVLEPNLKSLSRPEIKEYCRVRQHQIDVGETAKERSVNIDKAIKQARARVESGGEKHDRNLHRRAALKTGPREEADGMDSKGGGGLGPRSFRKREKVQSQGSAKEAEEVNGKGLPKEKSEKSEKSEGRCAGSRGSGWEHAEGVDRTRELARKEIARSEAARERADRSAFHRERADAAGAGPVRKGRGPGLHESEEMQRLNKVWASQESTRLKGGWEDAKVYGGIKYERKANGPFTGKLVSQGTIINIDGEDYVEYRVLTKPSF